MQKEVFSEAYRAGLQLEQMLRPLNQPQLTTRAESLHITLSLQNTLHAEAIILQSDAIVINAASLLTDEIRDNVMVAATDVKIKTFAYLMDHAPELYTRLSRKYGIGILAKP
ncbi:MAG TPA: hypothetical protein VLJ21_00135 [Candidatus Binatia bacterium]|nr:hypothetical protein [Candidatus Binatia bacterium]